MTAKQEESVTQTEQFNLPPYFIFKGSEIINSSLPCMLLDDKSEDTDESKHRNDVLSSKIIYSMSKCRMLEKVIKFEEKDEPRNKENKTISYKMIADPDPSYQCILFENIAKNDSQNEVKASEEISIQENSVEDNVEPDEVLSNNEQNSDKMNVRLSYLVCFTSTLYLVSMIIAGALFRNECPVQPLLPYYPFVTGIIGLMVMILRTSMVLFGGYLNYHEYFSVIIMLMSVHHLLESTNDPDWFINIIMCARIFLLIWFVFANYWFWTIWKYSIQI
ncbi:unnamed protein product [Lepeophtheirus salmonis]|uniref:(salmon louse) hypothetical protein n=1 Tax=Lepeophtheirus salmonis TaxID=72036 RepID=A0A7R8H889_LEPSM|nr:unnamed protein product [Lepeophtheirus salmonis]CAF2925810.1 unnamed protein product [Lepeophtheirus salmonis]